MKDSLSGNTRCVGVMGWPINHSKSPRLHGYWLRHYKIDGVYIPIPVQPACLNHVLKSLPMMGFLGVNVTIPHKNDVLELVDIVDPLAIRVGAVNTVVIKNNGIIEGYNTDVFGFMENLKDHHVDCLYKKVTVLGAGGASRAILVALQEMGASEICIVNRSLEKAESVAAHIREVNPHNTKISVYGWDCIHEALLESCLVVNTTSLGMAGQPPLEIDIGSLSQDSVLTDIVYTPIITDFLKKGQDRGLKIVDGLGMLLHQARPAFHSWFGIDPDVTPALRQFVLEGS